ncbi:MAG TPA: sigma-70 family RNA polymerase sigma factor, partial [Candidatus Hydrogenedentes bacterium]|nr:sigma-70 family RNA polymerase sigma factor [Candidatus Hydrogenedentota bacterium]
MYSSCVHAEKLTDEDLMMRLRKGDESALALLVERYQNDLFRFCLYYVREIEQAKEMAQETFLRVFVARDRFDTSRRFRPWVLCIARNLCLNELKRRKTVSMESLESYASAARDALSGVLSQSAEDMPDAQLIAAERR